MGLCHRQLSHAEAVTKATPAAESLFSWSHFWDIFKRFLDLGAPVGSYETDHLDLVEGLQ